MMKIRTTLAALLAAAFLLGGAGISPASADDPPPRTCEQQVESLTAQAVADRDQIAILTAHRDLLTTQLSAADAARAAAEAETARAVALNQRLREKVQELRDRLNGIYAVDRSAR